MSYYSAEEMKKTLKDYPKFQKRLYCRGFLITNEKQNVNLEYPFYANWKEETIGHSFYMYTHKETYAYTFEKNQVIHFIIVDDYMNIMTISACTKKLSDLRKVPREALAYVIDSTGAPVCVLLPFSTWAIFFAGIFYEQSEIVDLGYGSAMVTYIHAIPYMFYALERV